MIRVTYYRVLGVCTAAALLGCSKSGSGEGAAGGAQGRDEQSAEILRIDGSSTVYPITQAVAEEFERETRHKVTIGVSGTGGGFKKFCRGEIVISGASRPIKESEREACKQAGIDYIELPIAYDGLAVVVNTRNTWVDAMTVEELATMWAPEAEKNGITRWSQIRQGWPDKEFHLFGPGVDSGTYDYFTAAVVGTEHASRGDFTASEDDNVLVQGIATDEAALGFFGYAYYIENKARLKVVPIEDGDDSNGKGPIAPSQESVSGGTYQPLSRPIFIYVSATAARESKAVEKFVSFYLDQGRPLVKEVGYIPLPDAAYGLVVKRFTDRVTGSLFEDGSKVGVTIEAMLRGEG
jgi:phosphate transport system substrate-binding protein